MLQGQHVNCCIIYLFTFSGVFLHRIISLCFDTVTLKKKKTTEKKTNCIKFSDLKKEWWLFCFFLFFLFRFAFLYMYFVPKVLFTDVNNSMSSAICLEFLATFRRKALFLKTICRYWSGERPHLSALLLQLPPVCAFPPSVSLLDYFSLLPEEGAIVSCSCSASQQ